MVIEMDSRLKRELADWRERVESIAPTLRANGAESVRLRTLAPASVAALEEIEAFKLSGPREVGGLDAHPTTQLEAFVDLARADVSAGWCTMVQSMVAGLAGAHLREGEAFDRAFGTSYPKFSGTTNPEGPRSPSTMGTDSMVAGRMPAASATATGCWAASCCSTNRDSNEPRRTARRSGPRWRSRRTRLRSRTVGT